MAVAVIVGILVVQVQAVEAVLRDEAEAVLHEPRDLGGVGQELGILPLSGVVPSSQRQLVEKIINIDIALRVF